MAPRSWQERASSIQYPMGYSFEHQPQSHTLPYNKLRFQGLAPAASAGASTSSGNGSSSPFEVDAMMVDHHRRGSSVDGSRGMGSAGACVSAAVAAVVATAPTNDMHRVLSAPILSPAANTEAGGSEMDQNRLPPLRQVCHSRHQKAAVVACGTCL